MRVRTYRGDRTQACCALDLRLHSGAVRAAPAGALARPALLRGGGLPLLGGVALPRAAGGCRLPHRANGGRRTWHIRLQEPWSVIQFKLLTMI